MAQFAGVWELFPFYDPSAALRVTLDHIVSDAHLGARSLMVRAPCVPLTPTSLHVAFGTSNAQTAQLELVQGWE